MAVPTEPRQPVVYDMMLLAHALLKLRELEHGKIRQRDPSYCDKQTYFENALTKIRALSQFISATGENVISIESPEFGGTVDKRFVQSTFDSISKYLSHLHEQRYKKDSRYQRPKASGALLAGTEILTTLKPVMDAVKHMLTGDAAFWYEVFESKYCELVKSAN